LVFPTYKGWLEKSTQLCKTETVRTPIPRPCSVADALTVIGEKWSLLVIREISLGNFRFDAIARNTGAPRDVLTARLRSLESAGVVEKRQYQDRPPRFEYHLTQAGRELRPVLLGLGQWGQRWARGAVRNPISFTHECGHKLEIAHTCRACGGEVRGGRDLTPHFAEGWSPGGAVETDEAA
jgi:DNA-binding HxlR family transcriptional regulator